MSPDAGTYLLVHKTLSAAKADDVHLNQHPSKAWSDTDHHSRPLFTVERIECVQSLAEHVAKGHTRGITYGAILIDVTPESRTVVQEMVEQAWQIDCTLRCILCLAPEGVGWASNLSLSRPDQWAVLRGPFCELELFRLVCCLSTSSTPPTGSGTDAAGSQLEHLPGYGQEWKQQTRNGETARDELKASQSYVDNILRSMADSLFVINADMTIGAVNPALLSLLGYQEDELVGESPGSIFGEEFAQGIIFENLLLQGSVRGVESSFRTRQGQEIPISVSGSIMQDREGQFQGLVCVAQDITERRRMEEEKRRMHEQLLDTSRHLGMAEVATGVLHNVGNVLNSINVSIGVMTDLLKNSMVGDVGRICQLLEKHREDLGTYLMQNPKGKQIPGYLEKLSGQLAEEKRIALLELDRLRENAGHAQQCVAAQQDLAQPDGIEEPVVLALLVTEALTINQGLLEASGIEVLREFQDVPQVIVDKHQVLQILVDVIRNACQAMSAVATPQLTVRVRLLIGPPDSVSLEIQDTGTGIPQTELTKIFGQGYNAKHSGRGLSLHRGALMAKNMGGSLRAHSEGIGKGATFYLHLPGHFHFPDM